MKNIKRFLGLSLAAVSLCTLAACKEDTRNQQVPYGTLSDNAVVTAGNYKVTEKQLYNRLKFSYGYTVLTNKLNDIVYKDEYKAVIDEYKANGDAKVEIDKAVAEAIYGSSDLDTLKTKTEKDINKSIATYIDNMANQGLIITDKSMLNFDPINKDTKDISFSHLSDEIIKFYATSLAKEKANIAYLTDIADDEFIVDEDDNNIETENTYYIDEKDLEDKYNETYKEYNTAYGIILKFNSLEDAKRYMNLVGGLDASNLKSKYIEIYNKYYNYDIELTEALNENENTTFITDNENNGLDSISSSVSDFFFNSLEDGEGLLQPRNIGDKYYLIYRESVQYYVSKNNEIIDYEDLNAEQKADIDSKCKELIIESNASSVATQVFTDRIMDLSLTIYDPFLENSFANAYTDYDYTSTSNNNLIFSTNSDIEYTVDDFYNDLTRYNINEPLMGLLVNQLLLNEESSYLEDNARSDKEKVVKDNIKKFNKGETALNKAYGEANYLFYTYGYYTIDEVVNNQLASDIQTAYLADYISNNWITDDHKISDDSKLNILKNLLNTAIANYGKEDYIDVTVDHILISIDNNADGSPDNMDAFIANLSDEEKVEFQTALNNLAKAILDEALAINDHTNMDKLNYIVDAFNRNLKTNSGVTWDTYKTYNFILTAESLGEVTNDSISNYVQPFQDYLHDLYNKLVEEKIEIDEDDADKGFFYSPDGTVTLDNFKGVDFADSNSSSTLCQTNYGFHLLSVNTYEEKSENTLNFNLDDEEYSDVKIILDENEADDDNDDIYANVDLNNDNQDSPTLAQVLVYYVEYTDGDVTSFPSSLESDLSDLLDDVIAHYQTSNFQKFALYRRLGDITVNNKDKVGNFDYNFYMTYLMNQNESYDSESEYLSWYSLDGSINWNR